MRREFVLLLSSSSVVVVVVVVMPLLFVSWWFCGRQECDQLFGTHKQSLADAREIEMKKRRRDYKREYAGWVARVRAGEPNPGNKPALKPEFNREEQGGLMKYAQDVRRCRHSRSVLASLQACSLT